jgi:hypothetical protein
MARERYLGAIIPHRGANRNVKPERFPAKWKPIRLKKTRQTKNLEPRFDSIETEKALEALSELSHPGGEHTSIG